MIPGANLPQPLSERDANDLITLVQTAPLANLHQAKAVDHLCVRAQAHFFEFFALKQATKAVPLEAGATTPAAPGRKVRNGAKTPEAADPFA